MRSSREYPAAPVVGVGAFIHMNGRVLLVRRNRPPNMGRWALPGGVVELGETLQEAVVREVSEELGIGIKLEGLLDAVSSIHLDKRSRVKYHFVLIDYLARPETTSVRLNEESSSYGWFTPAQARTMNITEGTAEMVRKFQSLQRKHSRR